MPNLSFQNTEIAFAHKSTKELKQAKMLFKSFNYPWLIKYGDTLARLAITIGCKSVIKKIPFSVFKVTGIIAFEILEKASNHINKQNNVPSSEIGKQLSTDDAKHWELGVNRFFDIAKHAHSKQVRLFVDAEESWIQPAIDRLAEEAMKLYNMEMAIIFNTIQLYRHDRLAYLNQIIKSTSGFLGFKLVRGAYMEKERTRAKEFGYSDPIQPNKAATDADYNAAVKLCLENHARVSVCIGTHNEESSLLGTQIQAANNIPSNSSHVFYSQLLGMSDHISYNLAHAKYNVCKYVPYGPVSAVIPYLTRRAQENSGMAGQMGRELSLINSEIIRRKS